MYRLVSDLMSPCFALPCEQCLGSQSMQDPGP
jgi:hypothetical protein